MGIDLFPPTAFGPRGVDPQGSGSFGAPRGDRTHNGLDWETTPWAVVHFPCYGYVVRERKPYRRPKAHINTGILIRGAGEWEGLLVTVWYALPLLGVIGSYREPREPWGVAMPMREEYPGITPHVHIQVETPGGRFLDPTPMLLGGQA